MRFHFFSFEIKLERHPYRIAFIFHRSIRWYYNDYRKFKALLGSGNNDFPTLADNPCLDDKNEHAGKLDCHYFYQDLYVAEKIFQNNPMRHVDIGSRIDGFIAHVASYRNIELLDIREMELNIPNIIFKKLDLMDESNIIEHYCDSVSSLHALEHFGLGRYGDEIDPNGHIKGFKNITKMLKPGGIFYFSVPIGRQRIEFNAHRIFGMPYLMRLVSKDYDVLSFAFVDDLGMFHTNVQLTDDLVNSSFGCNYGCGIFELKKK